MNCGWQLSAFATFLVSSLANRFRTFDACQLPPRLVSILRAVSTPAMRMQKKKRQRHRLPKLTLRQTEDRN